MIVIAWKDALKGHCLAEQFPSPSRKKLQKDAFLQLFLKLAKMNAGEFLRA